MTPAEVQAAVERTQKLLVANEIAYVDADTLQQARDVIALAAEVERLGIELSRADTITIEAHEACCDERGRQAEASMVEVEKARADLMEILATARDEQRNAMEAERDALAERLAVVEAERDKAAADWLETATFAAELDAKLTRAWSLICKGCHILRGRDEDEPIDENDYGSFLQLCRARTEERNEARNERDAYKRAKAENDERFLIMPGFVDLQKTAAYVRDAALQGEPPDVQHGIDAAIVAATLFDWIAQNASEAQRVDVAMQVSLALELES